MRVPAGSIGRPVTGAVTAFDGKTGGSAARGMRKSSSSSSLQSRVARSSSAVRLALPVSMRNSPVSRCTSQESTVPTAISPRFARSRPGSTRSSSHANFRAENMGSTGSPVMLPHAIAVPGRRQCLGRRDGPAVLPAEHRTERFAGRAIPDDGRFTLGAERDARHPVGDSGDGEPHGFDRAVRDLCGVLLHPSGLRMLLPDRDGPPADDVPRRVDREGFRTTGALVDRDDDGRAGRLIHARGPPWQRRRCGRR